MSAEEVTNLKALEQENGRLKKLLAERDLEIEVRKEITRKSGKRTGTSNGGVLRESAWPSFATTGRCAAAPGEVEPLLHANLATKKCADRPRDAASGRVSTLRLASYPGVPQARGIDVGKKCSRLWAEQGLQVPKKRPRRSVATSSPRPLAPATANSV